MADEKNFDNENEEVKETAEVTEEVTEEVAENVESVEETTESTEETTETTAEEAVEEVEMTETEKAVAQAMEERDAQEAEAKAKKNKKIRLIAIIVAAVIVVGGAVGSGFVSKNATTKAIQFNTYGGWLPKLVNKYNHMGYVDVTGNTVGDIVQQLGITLPEFLKQYKLPSDLPKSTAEMAVIYLMPASSYAEMNGVDFDTLKSILKVPEKTEDGTKITGDTAWGVVEGEIAVKDYIGGEDNLDEFKKTYGLGDEVTGDTKWKEIRTAVDTYSKKQRAESAKATAQPAADGSANASAAPAKSGEPASTTAPKATQAAK